MSLVSLLGVGKAFRTYTSEWHRIGSWLGAARRFEHQQWVLRHVNIDISAGESIGIIGQNGAGKSTLLKLIAGIMKATEGIVHVNGDVAAILELGLAFNPELTGRENAFHAVSLMGFPAKEIEDCLPEIERFAELGDYFDAPMRTYSSGMQMRVAFAVATFRRPAVLIVDEALSVGDAYFQHKSFNRIREYQQDGTSLLIVSHDRSAIQALCGRAVLLEEGVPTKDGPPEEVFDFYNAIIADKEGSTITVSKLKSGKTQTCSGTGEALVEASVLYDSLGRETDCVNVGEAVRLHISVKVERAVTSLVLGFGIRDRVGQLMYGTNTWMTGQVVEHPNAGSQYHFDIYFLANLGVGTYSIQTALVDDRTHLTANYEWRDMALMFRVVNTDKAQFAGSLWLEPRIAVEEIRQ